MVRNTAEGGFSSSNNGPEWQECAQSGRSPSASNRPFRSSYQGQTSGVSRQCPLLRGRRACDRHRSGRPRASHQRGGAGGKLSQGAREGRQDQCRVLGTVVRQFHLHVVARSVGDPAWPGSVWRQGASQRYDEPKARALVTAAKAGLGPNDSASSGWAQIKRNRSIV